MPAEDTRASRKSSSSLVLLGIVVIVVLVGIVLAYFALTSATPKPVPIADVLADLRTYDGRAVTVQGEVTNTINLLGKKLYEIDDGTGVIRVVTERGLPKEGEHIVVTGIVNQLFSLGSSSFSVIYEQQERD